VCSGDPWTLHAALRCGTVVVCVDLAITQDTATSFWGQTMEQVFVPTPAPAAPQHQSFYFFIFFQ
jgi:hypothetical protein